MTPDDDTEPAVAVVRDRLAERRAHHLADHRGAVSATLSHASSIRQSVDPRHRHGFVATEIATSTCITVISAYGRLASSQEAPR